MIRKAKRQTLHIWIAMLAILFSALAPTVSHALNSIDVPSATLEICSVNGYKAVKAPDSNSSKSPSTTEHGMEHCAFCATHGGRRSNQSPPSLAKIQSVETPRAK